MSIKFKKPWVQYPEPMGLKLGKSMTVSGQSLPMSQIVLRYMSGQIFGISSFGTSFDSEFDDDLPADDFSDIQSFEGVYSPDAADFLAAERAAIEHKQIIKRFKKQKDEKKQNNNENGDQSSDVNELSPAS